MSLWKALRLLTEVGTIFTVIGELMLRLGGPREGAPVPDGNQKSQDSSNSNGAEDEKPEEEDHYRDY